MLLVIDSEITSAEQMVSLHRFANARGIPTLLFIPVNDLHQPTHQALLNELDVQLWFSPVRASQGLWPAIDPLTSCSRLLASDAVTLDHWQVAQRVREILERYHEFHANRNNAPLGEEQRQTLMRGERIDLFFSQPFVVAEAFTDIPGMYLTREETISSFRDLLDGRDDASPTHVFKFVGMIEPN